MLTHHFGMLLKEINLQNLLKTLSDSGGILGLSLYPHHLKDNTNCTIRKFL